MDRFLTVLCAARLHKNQLERHLELFEHVPEVGKVILVRHEALPSRLSKLDQRTFAGRSFAERAYGFTRTIAATLSTERVDWVVGFNPVPWGSLAFLPAKRHHTKVCLSLIGRDFQQVRTWWGRPFLEAVRRSNAVTVTGAGMQRGLVEAGVDPARIRVLPHSVDLARFTPSTSPARFDVIAVGQLIRRKRMDVLIDAVAVLAERGIELRVGVAGRGPLESVLRQQAAKRGVSHLVEFLGYRDDVEALLASARTFCLASEWEGVPFALMEAMAAGLVPVVTDVGTVADWIDPGQNGFLVRPGSVADLAAAWTELFRPDGGQLERMRQVIVGQRGRLGLQVGARVWRELLTSD